MARKVQPVAEGGTGATTAADARTNLAVNSAADEALRDGYIVDAAAAPATPPAGRRVLYRLTGDGLLRIKDSAGTASYLDEFVDVQASSAALQASSPAASNTGKWGIVTGTTTDSGIYRSNGTAWVLIVGTNNYTKAETDALDEFTRTGGKIQPKDAYASEEFRIGSASTAYLVDAVGAGAGKFTGTTTKNAQVAGFQTSNDTTLSDGHTITSASTNTGTNFPWHAFDNSGATGWRSLTNGTETLVIQFPTARAAVSYTLRGIATAEAESIASWRIEGSNDGTTWDILDSRSGQTYGAGSVSFTMATPGSYTRYQIVCLSNQGGAASYLIVAFELYENDVTTTYVYSGANIAFAPGSLEIKQGASAIGDNAGLVTLDYSVNSGAYTGSYITLAAFKALDPAIFAVVGDLKIKVKHTGIFPLTSLSMSTTSSAIIFSPSGSIRAEINSIVVWETTSAGDQTSVDMNVATLTSTGPVQGATIVATGNSSLNKQHFVSATTTTGDGSPTANIQTPLAIAIGANQILSVTMDAVAREPLATNSALKACYRIHGVFYRNGTGNVTLLGDLVSVNTQEEGTITALDATIIVNGTTGVQVQVTGNNSNDFEWQVVATYHLL